LLHVDLEEEDRKVRLTGEEVGAAEGDGVDGENFHGLGEMPRGWS
jgi:hypothetical protein